MPILYILCGAPGCGKSTYAAHMLESDNNIRYVSRDEIRYSIIAKDDSYFSKEKLVFKQFINTIAQTLVKGFDVIADATHLTPQSRFKLTHSIDQLYTDYKIVYILFLAPVEVCLARNNKRAGREKVPEDAIIRMRNNFTIPQNEDKREIGRITIEGDIFNV